MLKDEKGAAAVEFAIVLPLLALILFGTIDFALLFYNKQVLTNASREGARSAIVTDNQTDTSFPNQRQIIKDYCVNNLINLGGTNTLAIEPQITLNTPSTGYITSIVQYDYSHLLSGVTGFSSTRIEAQTVMRSEQ